MLMKIKIHKESNECCTFHLQPEGLPENLLDLCHEKYDNTSVFFGCSGRAWADCRKNFYEYRIPMETNFSQWWVNIPYAFRYIHYVIKYLTKHNIPYTIEGDLNQFQLTNKQGKVYACYL